MTETTVNSSEAVNNDGSSANTGEMGGMRRAIAGGLIGTTVGYLMTPEAGKKLFGNMGGSAIGSKGASFGQAVKNNSKKAASKLFGKGEQNANNGSGGDSDMNNRLDRLEQMITKMAGGEQLSAEDSDNSGEEGSYVESPVQNKGENEEKSQQNNNEKQSDSQNDEQQDSNDEEYESLKQENEDLQNRLGKIEDMLSKMTESKDSSEQKESKAEKEDENDKSKKADEEDKETKSKSTDSDNKSSNERDQQEEKKDDDKNSNSKDQNDKKKNESKSDEKNEKDKKNEQKDEGKNNGTYLSQDGLKKEA